MTADAARPPKPPRATLTSIPERYTLPPRPTVASAAVLDSHRQTGFLIGNELSIFERAMNLQLGIVAANSRVRGAPAAAVLTLWSRTFSHLADACSLMTCGSYASCPPLLRAALDCLAAQRALGADNFAEYEDWLTQAITQDREHNALALDLGRFKAASVLISDDRLGLLYRILMELSMPHFGSSTLFAAPEASPQKLALAFADGSFHLGWAELITGWLLVLAGEQTATATHCGAFTLDATVRSDAEAVQREIQAAAADKRRCRVEDAAGRFLVHNFRRTPSGQPKRIILG